MYIGPILSYGAGLLCLIYCTCDLLLLCIVLSMHSIISMYPITPLIRMISVDSKATRWAKVRLLVKKVSHHKDGHNRSRGTANWISCITIGVSRIWYCDQTPPCTHAFYRAVHFSAKRGIAIACRPSVCPSV